jgi:hypothetical protein
VLQGPDEGVEGTHDSAATPVNQYSENEKVEDTIMYLCKIQVYEIGEEKMSNWEDGCGRWLMNG